MSVHALEEELRQQIRPAQCVIVLAGMYVAHSDWIQFEIDFAQPLDKPILGIMPWGVERAPISVSLVANKMVGWNANTIASGIREVAL